MNIFSHSFVVKNGCSFRETKNKCKKAKDSPSRYKFDVKPVLEKVAGRVENIARAEFWNDVTVLRRIVPTI